MKILKKQAKSPAQGIVDSILNTFWSAAIS